MRSIIHRNKWTNFSEINTGQILNWLTEKVKIEFETLCTNRYAIPFVRKAMKLTTL